MGIRANELRIGNKINVYSDVVEVTDIGDDGIIGTTAYFDGQKGCCGCTELMAEPVPLSPSILEKCGFEYNYFEGTAYQLTLPDGTGLQVNPPNFTAICYYGQWLKCEYLHQFQNLFFALTGEELEVRL